MCVAELMSLSRDTESVSRGPMSRRSRSGLLGKEVTVLFSATVALLMVDMAATIAAPSAIALATSSERGRRERCILRIVLRRKQLGDEKIDGVWERGVRWGRIGGGRELEDILLLQAVKIFISSVKRPAP